MDKAAKEAAMRGRVRTAKWTNLTHIKQPITVEKKLRISTWNEQKTKEREVSRRGLYISSLKTLKRRSTLLSRTKKLYASRSFLERIGAVEVLKHTEVGCREGAAEKSAQDGEDQLGDL